MNNNNKQVLRVLCIAHFLPGLQLHGVSQYEGARGSGQKSCGLHFGAQSISISRKDKHEPETDRNCTVASPLSPLYPPPAA